MGKVKISIIIPTYNNYKILENSLSSYQELAIKEYMDVELIIVDNNSTDRTAGIIKNYKNHRIPEIIYLFEGRQGRSFALNNAIDRSTGKFLFFSDDDVNVSKQWLIKGMEYLSNHADIVGGKITPIWECERPRWLKDSMLNMLAILDKGDISFKISDKSVMLYGANVAVKREVIEVHGSFNIQLGVAGGRLSGYEDVEFLFRMIDGGASVYYAPEMEVFHKIPNARCQKKYFIKWMKDRTYSQVLYNALYISRNDEMKRVVGIPRWIYKELFLSILKWFKKRMFYGEENSFEDKLEIVRFLSYMKAHRRLKTI